MRTLINESDQSRDLRARRGKFMRRWRSRACRTSRASWRIDLRHLETDASRRWGQSSPSPIRRRQLPGAVPTTLAPAEQGVAAE